MGVAVHRDPITLLRLEHAVSSVLAEAVHSDEAYVRVLAAVGESLGAQVGGVWVPAGPDGSTLRCAHTWHSQRFTGTAFERTTESLTLARGEGLPGRVWGDREPAWIVDLGSDENFPRAAVASGAHLTSALCFPVTGPEDCHAVLEFFSDQPWQPDSALLGTLVSLGQQLGRFIEHRAADEEIRAAAARMQATLEAALDGVITIESSGRIVDMNSAAEHILGRRLADVRGAELGELIVPEQLREAHRQGLARYLATGKPRVMGRRVETTALRATGEEFPVELAITRINTNGAPMFTGHLRDLTEQKRITEEARAARARVMKAEDQARRRLERDLHDGAQQRLVALALTLQMAQASMTSDPSATAELLEEASGEVNAAIQELRHLARGLHPSLLAAGGLEGAVRALAARAPMPVEVGFEISETVDGPIETAVYFIVAETLTNAARHARAAGARIAVRTENARLQLTVADDGEGGAGLDRGSGLRGLADRVHALDGTIEVESPLGQGTTISVALPCTP